MHLADGILSGPVLAGGTALAVTGIGIGVRRLAYEDIPKTAVLAAAFFVASLIHVPVGPGQVHLILNGLTGIILGWSAFPAIFIALLLQAVLFGYGGITVLGVNTFNMAFPAVACYFMFGPIISRAGSQSLLMAIGFAVGAAAIALNATLMALSLYLSNTQFTGIIITILIAHVPIMLIEGALTGAAIIFLKKVRPEMLSMPVKATPGGP